MVIDTDKVHIYYKEYYELNLKIVFYNSKTLGHYDNIEQNTIKPQEAFELYQSSKLVWSGNGVLSLRNVDRR